MTFRFTFDAGTFRDERGRVVDVDPRPLASDWTSLWALFTDMHIFALKHPGLTFMAADDPGLVGERPKEPRLGWAALNGTEMVKTWTITLTHVRATQGEMPENFRILLRSRELRAALLHAVLPERAAP